MTDNVLIYDDHVANAEYSRSHPYKPVRARLFMELLNRYFHLDDGHFSIKRPEPLDEELLCLFHDKSYVELLKRADSGEFNLHMLRAGLGTSDNPVFTGMFDLLRRVAGGTYEGAMLLCNGQARVVFSPVSGFHHAGKTHASGFCYFNDVAIAITSLIKRGKRVAYVDIDVHHCDGVQEAFYATDQVLKISFHESGETLFPWTGFETEIGTGAGKGYNVNIPLRAGTDDGLYVSAFDAIVPPLLEAYLPDVVLTQIGGDSHRDDHLSHLNLTSNGYKHAVETVRRLSPRIMAMGGGGYNIFKTAALWTVAWSALTGIEPQDKFAGLVGGVIGGHHEDGGRLLRDTPFVLEGREKDVCAEQLERVVRYIKQTVFPIHGL
jgi:acetoin utilization protein AcuC